MDKSWLARCGTGRSRHVWYRTGRSSVHTVQYLCTLFEEFEPTGTKRTVWYLDLPANRNSAPIKPNVGLPVPVEYSRLTNRNPGACPVDPFTCTHMQSLKVIITCFLLLLPLAIEGFYTILYQGSTLVERPSYKRTTKSSSLLLLQRRRRYTCRLSLQRRLNAEMINTGSFFDNDLLKQAIGTLSKN